MKVYLVGAGPGDPGLLTLRAKEVLEQVDVIVYDFLSSPAFLAYAKPGAELIYVGKKGSEHTLPQAEINQLIIDKARAGLSVARLKGGDPYIFGRGGEEAEELLQAGVAFEEVPGISSTIAGPAYAGIPLTHRDFASSVTLITGHENPNKPGSVHNWAALAQSANTLVFVMGMKNLGEIAKNLMQAGLAADMPAALVHWGTTSKHRSLVSTLANLQQDAKEQGFTNPSVIVVGKVVSLAPRLNWFEQKPLLGKKIVVTRAREQASSMVKELTALGAEVLQFPTIKIQELTDYRAVDAALLNLSNYDWVVFTSINGVQAVQGRMDVLQKDSRIFAPVSLVAIGPATAQGLQNMGLRPDFVPEAYMAEGIVEGMLAKGMAQKRILILRAKEAREVLPEELSKAGAKVEIIPVYETKPALENKEEVLAGLADGSINCISFASSSTVDNFLEQIPGQTVQAAVAKGLKLACIGPVTRNNLQKHGLACAIEPEKFTIPQLVAAIAQSLA